MMRSSSALLLSFVWTLLHSSSIPGTHEQHPSSLPVTHFHHTQPSFLPTALQTSPLQANPSRSCSQPVSVGGGGGASWAVATARLYPIRTRSVEKGCGLEPVTSVPLPLPPRHSAEKGREKEAREGENTKEVLASQLAVCMISSSSSFHVRRVYPLFALQPSQKHILNLTGIFL